ncbi:Uncharacterised protein [Legionella bozemanae]|uniref:Uncharacterized protein n=1 Tax=Legionella bozemanae TaxID=447 RepID=A0A0W0RF02_LEGBO|nr:hypothetical protein Lboz_3126 [Legionella bozemanae]STO33093.1 Uncharacterised protein [Legionella bozemanae]
MVLFLQQPKIRIGGSLPSHGHLSSTLPRRLGVPVQGISANSCAGESISYGNNSKHSLDGAVGGIKVTLASIPP